MPAPVEMRGTSAAARASPPDSLLPLSLAASADGVAAPSTPKGPLTQAVRLLLAIAIAFVVQATLFKHFSSADTPEPYFTVPVALPSRSDVNGDNDSVRSVSVPEAPHRASGTWKAAWAYCHEAPPCVLAGSTSANASEVVISARGSRQAEHTVSVGEVFDVLVRARDAAGRERGCGGDSFEVEISGPSLYSGHAVDNLDGTHSFSAVLYNPGVYHVRARLDFRACEGLVKCDAKRTTHILLEFVGHSPLRLEVVDGAPTPDASPAWGAEGRAPCDVTYDVGRPFDDPAYRRGRWVRDAVACERRHPQGAPDSPSISAGALSESMKERCGSRVLRSDGLVWRPLIDERSVFPTHALRGQWLHSIGDSVSRGLNLSVRRVLGGRGIESRLVCVYLLAGGKAYVDPVVGLSYLHDGAESSPFLVYDDCDNQEVIKGRVEWQVGASGQRFRGAYRILWTHVYFPALDFRLTEQWMSLQDWTNETSIYNEARGVPYLSFRSWALAPFIAHVDRHKAHFALNASQHGDGAMETLAPTPSEALSKRRRSAGFAPDASPEVEGARPTRSPGSALSSAGRRHGRGRVGRHSDGVGGASASSVQSKSVIQDDGAVQSRRRRRDAPPEEVLSMELVDTALLHELFPPDATPSHVLINAGLHHIEQVFHLDTWYERHVRDILARVRADFPAPATRLSWRSTSQTQWREKELPRGHMCRTSYRVAYVNEIAADVVAEMNDAEIAAGGPAAAITVLDFYQVSLGRPDAAPDNRHYGFPVQAVVVDEMLNAMAGCAPADGALS